MRLGSLKGSLIGYLRLRRLIGVSVRELIGCAMGTEIPNSFTGRHQSTTRGIP